MNTEDLRRVSLRWVFEFSQHREGAAFPPKNEENCLWTGEIRRYATGLPVQAKSVAHVRECAYCLEAVKTYARVFLADYFERNPMAPPCECDRSRIPEDELRHTVHMLGIFSVPCDEVQLWDPWEEAAIQVLTAEAGESHERLVPVWARILRDGVAEWLITDPPEEVSEDALEFRRSTVEGCHWPMVSCLMLRMAAMKMADDPTYSILRMMFLHRDRKTMNRDILALMREDNPLKALGV